MTYDEYLAHHGILGMRWGKRNGPPYPLNESQMSSKERAKNEVSEYALKESVKRAKFKEQVKLNKLKEREQIRQNKAKEREERRQNRADEKEARRQNKIDEREMVRQNRVDEKELSKQNDAESREKWEQYKRGRTYVRKFLIGAGVMTVAGLAVYKGIKARQLNLDEAKKAAETVANRGNAADAARSIREVAKKTTGSSPVITPPNSNRMQSTFKYINDAYAKGIIGKGAKSTSKIVGKNVSGVPRSPSASSMAKAMNWINSKSAEKVIGPYAHKNPFGKR